MPGLCAPLLLRRRLVTIAILGLVGLFFLTAVLHNRLGIGPNTLLSSASRLYGEAPLTSDASTGAALLHLLVPANHAGENLCRTIVSAAVNGYPSPTLINWGETFNDTDLVAGGSHLGKIKGVLSYLSKLDEARDEDLVLVVDGYDIWFQLPPSVLIERYHAINLEANKRIQKEMGIRAFTAEGINQTVVFSAQKRCWPWKMDDAPCYAVPESSLPTDVYGPETDTEIADKKGPYAKYRQRYLNSGNVMGPVKDMRALFNKAKRKAEKDPNFGSDQKVFSEMFGDQEFQREVMRQRYFTLQERWTAWWSGAETILGPHPTHNLKTPHRGRPDEFGIGLDYASLLGHPTVFCEEDSEWIVRSDKEDIARKSAALKIKTSRVGELEEEILRSQPPYRVAAQNPKFPVPPERSWKDVPLLTNMWTGVVPALIHHNAHRDGLKSRRRTWWDKTWYFDGLRSLYQASNDTSGPVAVTHFDQGEQGWWPAVERKGGAMPDKGEWVHWDELCEKYETQVFRDELATEKANRPTHTPKKKTSSSSSQSKTTTKVANAKQTSDANSTTSASDSTVSNTASETNSISKVTSVTDPAQMIKSTESTKTTKAAELTESTQTPEATELSQTTKTIDKEN